MMSLGATELVYDERAIFNHLFETLRGGKVSLSSSRTLHLNGTAELLA
jgi:hypothetical protein